jgi:hypothetical protein
MRIIKRYSDNLEAINSSINHVDSYAPNMGDFSLDTSVFLDSKIDIMLNKNHNKLKTYLPSEKASHPKTPAHESSHDLRNNRNN